MSEPAAADPVQIANEFTTVRVRKVRTRNGERLEIISAKMGTSVLLDPLELESLTWQTPETFSRLLEHPYGPEDVAPQPLTALLRSSDGTLARDGQQVSFDEG